MEFFLEENIFYANALVEFSPFKLTVIVMIVLSERNQCRLIFNMETNAIVVRRKQK